MFLITNQTRQSCQLEFCFPAQPFSQCLLVGEKLKIMAKIPLKRYSMGEVC